jgi:malate dehydrogenase (oxaloacetate-decarboxylating)(NADP+)
MVQLEDFGNSNAFRLLQRYRNRLCLFDDDIQGTGAVGLAGLLGALRISGKKLEDQRILFYGAGQAGLGIGSTVSAALQQQGLGEDEARQRCWFFDSRGLLVSERDNVPAQKLPFAHDHPPVSDFLKALQVLRPTAIIGCAGQAGVFNEAVVRQVSDHNERPIISALSNPTVKAECTAEQAYQWSDGRAIFASGSPFPPVKLGLELLEPGQGNNAYIFPGVGLGAIVSHTSEVSDEMFLAAARVLSEQVRDEDLAVGRVYPKLERIREVSIAIAAEVASIAHQRGLAQTAQPEDILQDIQEKLFVPVYPHYA